MKGELLPVLEQIEKEKSIKKEEILHVIESALASAYRKHAGGKNVNVEAHINPETAEVTAHAIKKVVQEVLNSAVEISLEEARVVEPTSEIGSEIKIPLDTQEFSRIAAQTAKQVIIQKIRESERSSLFDEFKLKEGQVMTGVVYRFVDRNIIIDLGKTEGIIPVREQVFSEKFRVGEHIKVLIVYVEKSARGPRILLSRNRPELVRRLFELEVPEIYEKIIEIKNVVREAGIRSKVVVYTSNPKIDPVGSCVGVKGSRVKPIIEELRGERIDLVLYSSDIVKYITSAFSPAKILQVNLSDPVQKRARVIVADDMLSLAIGKRGTNVNLVSRLTGWQIDVRSESQIKEAAQKQAIVTVEELSKLKGVGEKLADILSKAGWKDIRKLATAGVPELTSLQGIGEKKALKIIEAAKKHIEGLESKPVEPEKQAEKPKEEKPGKTKKTKKKNA